MSIKRFTKSAARQAMIRRDKLLRAELRDEMRQTARDAKNWLEVAVREWHHKPHFAAHVTLRPDYMEIKVNIAGTYKKIFVYVDQGTGKWGKNKAPYPIPKVVTPGKYLKFQTGYSARTAPGAKINVGTGTHFGEWVSKAQVMHPGIEPRHFTKKVFDELKPDFTSRVENALKRGAAKK